MAEQAVTDTSGIVEGDGHFLHGHPDIMANPAAKNALSKYDSAEKAMIGGVEAMKLIGKPHINIPADDADEAVKTEFRAKIAKHAGKPDTVEGYKITRPEGSNSENYNEALEKTFLKTALAKDMNQDQVEATYGLALKMIEAIRTKETTDLTAAAEKCRTQLTNDCGGEANYKTFSELNTRLLESFFGVETAKAIETTGMGNDIGFCKGINKLAEMAVKEGRTMTASHQTGTKAGGVLQYPKMEKRAKTEGG